MTSVLSNVRSHFPQPGMSNEPPRYQYADLSRTLASSASSSSIPSTSSLGLAAATPATTMSSAPSSVEPSSLPQLSVMPPSASSSHPDLLYSTGTIPTSRGYDQVTGVYTSPTGLQDLSASCPPDSGPTLSTTDFDAEVAAAAFAPIFGSSLGDTIGLDSSAPLSFPVLPASLLNDAPEYEYSVHTRMNVFEASDYGDIPSFAFAEDGTPLLDNPTEYGLWSTGIDVDAADLSGSSAFAYPEDDLGLMGGNRLDAQPRSAGLHISQYDLSTRPDDQYHAGSDSLLLSRAPLVPADDLLAVNAPGMSNLPGSSAGGVVEGAPSVLHPGPAANQMQQQRHPQQPQRFSLEGDDMYESQAGPSRSALHRPRDALSAATSPYGRNRPMLQGHRSFANIGAAAGFSPPDFQPELRRTSTGGGMGPLRGPSRDPVVPSQNAGRARLMNWQSTFPDANGGDPGFGDVHGMADPMGSNGMQMQSAGGMMPPSRSYSYGMHQSNSGFMPNHGMDFHASDMINRIGDEMDARIDVDGIAKCPYPNCNKTFAKNRSYNLKAHLRSHSQLKPFACAVCPRAFSRKHDLERHSRVHSGDKPYVCEICGKGFPRSDALRRHWRVEKECGDKAAELEASQSLTSVLGDGYGHERSPDQQNHHQYGHMQQQQQQHQASSSGMYSHPQQQQQPYLQTAAQYQGQQRPPQFAQQQQQQQQQQQGYPTQQRYADQHQQQQQLRRA